MINTLCICGAGTMGRGIAQSAATAGIFTLVYEMNEEVLNNAKISIEKNLQSLVEKNKISSAVKENTLNHLRFIHQLSDCLADVVIEAIPENFGAKIALFNQLAEINHSETIFASNTSSLSITELAKGIKNPERVLGLHFFNPAAIMKLVEVVKTDFTNENIVTTVIQLARQMGKHPVLCKDSPGFIVNRVARPFYIESLRLIEEKLTDIPSLDQLMEATGFKMGPFVLMDLIGNDVNHKVSSSLYEQLGKPERLKPSALQKEKVEKGELGRKTKTGYYRYE